MKKRDDTFGLQNKEGKVIISNLFQCKATELNNVIL